LTGKSNNIAFKFYKDLDSAKTALKLKEVHGLGGLSPQEVEQIKNFGGYQVFNKALSSRQVLVYFNLKNNFLNDKRVRQALSYLVDKPQIVHSGGGEGAITATGPFPLATWVPPGPERYQTNKERSTQLLDLAGFIQNEGRWTRQEEKLQFSITVADDLELNSVANTLKQLWSEFGIGVDVEFVSLDKLKGETIPNRDFDVLVNFQDVPEDPDQYVLWHTTQIQNTNLTGISQARLDKILEDARRVFDQKERTERYKLFTTLLLDESPAIFLYYPAYNWIVSDNVYGIDFSNFKKPADRFASLETWRIEKEPF
jgi:peptide/nickel transport system substrate-binding protein